MMSFWTFSDVFEENGPIPEPFQGHFGLRAKGGINKPSYYAFGLLHRLGDRRFANAAPNVLVTKRKDGALVVAVWNLVDPDQSPNRKMVRLVFDGLPNGAGVEVSRVDAENGNTLAAYRAMGSPRYPTEQQINELNAVTQITASGHHLDSNHLDLSLQGNALVLIEALAGS